jgi:hypothetical protein
MPLLQEVKRIQFRKRKSNHLLSVAIGVSTKNPTKHRRIDGFIDCWQDNDDIGKIMIVGQNDLESKGALISTGRVSHYDCYNYASEGHIGIIPFKPHPYHKFSGALKAYLYIHSGLALVTPASQPEFKPVIQTIGAGFQFKNYNELVKSIREKKEELLFLNHEEIIRTARDKFVLDNYLDTLLQAYETSLEK